MATWRRYSLVGGALKAAGVADLTPGVIVDPLPVTDLLLDDTVLGYVGTGWQTYADTANSGGTQHYTDTIGDYATTTITVGSGGGGTMTLMAKTAPHHGIMTVAVDGGSTSDIDLYSAATLYQQDVWTSAALAAGDHTVRFTHTGRKNASGSGTVIQIDAIRAHNVVDNNPPPPPPPPPPVGDFLTRSGDRITLAGVAWRATGINLPWSFGCSADIGLPPSAQQHQALFANAKQKSLYRVGLYANFTNYGTDFSAFDALLTAARPYGHRFDVILFDAGKNCGEPFVAGLGSADAFASGWQSVTVGGITPKEYIRRVFTKYQAEPLIGMYEWFKKPPLTQAVRDFFDAAGAYVRNELSDRHLLCTGTGSEWGDSTGMRLLNTSQYIDVCSQHEYDWNEAPSHWTSADAGDAAAAGKPWIVGESGIAQSQIAYGQARADQITAKIDALNTQWPTCAAYLYWSGAAKYRDTEVPIDSSPEISVINTRAFGGTVVQPSGFLTTSGETVLLNGSRYTGVGVNLPWWAGCGAEVGLPPTLSQLSTMFSNARSNSFYRLPLFAQDCSTGTNFTNFDAILNAARPYGHRFCVILHGGPQAGCGEPYSNMPGGWSTFINGAYQTWQWNGATWKDYVTRVVNYYKNEPLIGMWEWFNEPSHDQPVRNLFDNMGAYIRNTLGDSHLITTGTSSEYGDSSGMRLLNSSPYIDVCQMHEYDEQQSPSGWMIHDYDDAHYAGKPFFVGESGIRYGVMNGQARADRIGQKIDAQKAQFPTCFAYVYWTGSNPNATNLTDYGSQEIGIVGTPEIGVINTRAL